MSIASGTIEPILSAGIDIGTSTTLLVFSRLTIKNTAGLGRIPKPEIVKKEILYRSNVYFTPLSSQEQIDGEKVREIIKKEYELAGIRPEQLSTGAVIITGESSGKKNARQVAESLAEFAGNFVVAAAGPDLESVLAGKGSGAAALSKKSGKLVANLDIGGGTTNICYFNGGEIYDTACLDIGGRLIKTERGKIVYLSDKLKRLIAVLNIDIREGGDADLGKLTRLTRAMAGILTEAVGLREKTPFLALMKTNRLICVQDKPDIVMFSGGVASCMDQDYSDFEFGDLGVLLAKAISAQPEFCGIESARSSEVMRATVIGAGNYSMDLSGSTIEYTSQDFPMKNLPVIRIKLETEEDIETITAEINRAVSLFRDQEGQNLQIALAMAGIPCPGFSQIQEMASRIMEAYDQLFDARIKMVLILEADTGKALGQALKRINRHNRSIVCIDGIASGSGDYIDLGIPIAGGTAIPVVVKTLIFNS